MRTLVLFTAVIGVFAVMPAAHAAPVSITYTYGHHLFTVYPSRHPEWRQTSERWFFRGMEAVPPARMQSCGKESAAEPGWTKEQTVDWSEQAIQETIRREIALSLDRDTGSVTMDRNASGTIVFTGQGLTGRSVNAELAALLTKKALETDTAFVAIPVTETQPKIVVNDPELRHLGIKEVVTIGESVFAKSPVNRRHNIGVGVSKFNGHLIPQGAIFSFNEVLGPVNATTGYRRELVIQGDTTIPDYGGGLCQVSSTAYRGPWEYGMPIVQRKNHSYAVSYYSPQGTDATIYPPNVDIKFKNNTPAALLMQTFTDDKDRAFFIYYGTRDDRTIDVFGPYITDRVAAPTGERIVYTTDIPVGEKRKAGERHDGMKAMWYRSVGISGSGTTMERFFSAYEARPLTFQIGVTADDMALRTPSALSEQPSWLPSKP